MARSRCRLCAARASASWNATFQRSTDEPASTSNVLADSMASSSRSVRRAAANEAILTSIVSRSSQISSSSAALSRTQTLQQRPNVSRSLTLDPPRAPLLVTM